MTIYLNQGLFLIFTCLFIIYDKAGELIRIFDNFNVLFSDLMVSKNSVFSHIIEISSNNLAIFNNISFYDNSAYSKKFFRKLKIIIFSCRYWSI